jgi:hypothetical protein
VASVPVRNGRPLRPVLRDLASACEHWLARHEREQDRREFEAAVESDDPPHRIKTDGTVSFDRRAEALADRLAETECRPSRDSHPGTRGAAGGGVAEGVRCEAGAEPAGS